MCANTLVQVRDGRSSLLFDKWMSQSALVDVFEREEMADLRAISIAEAYVHGQWDVVFLSNFLNPVVIGFLQQLHFTFSTTLDVIIW